MKGTVELPGLAEELRLIRDEVKALAERQPDESPWLNIDQAALYLGSTPEAVRAAVKRKQLPAHRTATSRVLLRREELDVFATAGDAS